MTNHTGDESPDSSPGVTGSTGDQGRDDIDKPEITAAKIAVRGGIIVAIIGGIFALVPNLGGSDSGGSSQPSVSSPGSSSPGSSSPGSSPPDSSPPDSTASSKVHWRGPVELPLTLNAVSNTGVELDGEKPVFSGTDDDLRGDYSSSPGIFVISGRAAEEPGDVSDLKSQECEQGLRGGVSNNPVEVAVFRGNGMNGTYCFTTTKGRIAAFTVVSAGPDPVLPESVTVEVVVWE